MMTVGIGPGALPSGVLNNSSSEGQPDPSVESGQQVTMPGSGRATSASPGGGGRGRGLRLASALLLLFSLIWPLQAAPLGPAPVANAQDLVDQATLTVSQPQVQWSPAGEEAWQAVPTQQTVRVGDRV